MAEFHKAFDAIDEDGSGEITVSELKAYMEKNHYKPVFVEKWMKLFDTGHTGQITYEQFCKTLGLVPKEREAKPKRISVGRPELSEAAGGAAAAASSFGTALESEDVAFSAPQPIVITEDILQSPAPVSGRVLTYPKRTDEEIASAPHTEEIREFTFTSTEVRATSSGDAIVTETETDTDMTRRLVTSVELAAVGPSTVRSGEVTVTETDTDVTTRRVTKSVTTIKSVITTSAGISLSSAPATTTSAGRSPATTTSAGHAAPTTACVSVPVTEPETTKREVLPLSSVPEVEPVVEISGSQEAFITLATHDDEALGTLVLAYSLKQVETTKELVVMVTKGVSQTMRDVLASVFDRVELVDLADDPINHPILAVSELSSIFVKLHCWRLTRYRKAVFLAADTMVLQNVDDLFDYEELSAVPEPSWPDCFSSALFVFRPSLQTYTNLMQLALEVGSFDGTDQGLLNQYFQGWAERGGRLAFVYNCVCLSFYSHLPAWLKFKDSVKVFRFPSTSVRPWYHPVDRGTRRVQSIQGSTVHVDVAQRWWDLFFTWVQPHLPALDGQTTSEVLAAMSATSVASPATSHTDSAAVDTCRDPSVVSEERRMSWERGEIDYKGTDKFDSILVKIRSSIGSGTAPH